MALAIASAAPKPANASSESSGTPATSSRPVDGTPAVPWSKSANNDGVQESSAKPTGEAAPRSPPDETPEEEIPDDFFDEFDDDDSRDDDATKPAPTQRLGAQALDRRQWMFQYLYRYRGFIGTTDGLRRTSQTDVVDRYRVVPLTASAQVHTAHVMYAPLSWLAIDVSASFHARRIKNAHRTGFSYQTRSAGFGDLTADLVWTAVRRPAHRLLVLTGLSFPTGSTDERAETPQGRAAILPYFLQIGTGTFDPRPAVAYRGHAGNIGFGARLYATLRFGYNKRGYRLGNDYAAEAWAEYLWAPWLNTGAALRGSAWGGISGLYPDLDPTLDPTSDPNATAGRRILLVAFANFRIPNTSDSFLLEAGGPPLQHLEGPQLRMTWQLTLGWSHTWNMNR